VTVHAMALRPAPTSSHEATIAASLIICSRNRPHLLTDTVASILQGQKIPEEIVVVDQSDQRHPTLATEEPEAIVVIRYLWTPGDGLGRGRNVGIKAARHPIIAITDDDMLADPTWFGSLIAALIQAGPKAVVTGSVLSAEPSDVFVPSTNTNQTSQVYEGRVGKDVLWAGNMSLFGSAFHDVGLFDERMGPGTPFPGAEDNDLGFRLLEAGYQIVYVPDAVLYHRAWRSKHEFLPLRWGYGVGRGAFYAKHLRLQDGYILRRMLHDVLAHFRVCMVRCWSQPRLACGDALLGLGIIWGATRWLLTRPTPSSGSDFPSTPNASVNGQ
jgi:GT2 family glycosyltransferase